KPAVVSTLIVARSETLTGAALLANAISAACGIRYSPMGGYVRACDFGACGAAKRTAGNSREISGFLMGICLLALMFLPAAITNAAGQGIRACDSALHFVLCCGVVANDGSSSGPAIVLKDLSDWNVVRLGRCSTTATWLRWGPR